MRAFGTVVGTKDLATWKACTWDPTGKLNIPRQDAEVLCRRLGITIFSDGPTKGAGEQSCTPTWTSDACVGASRYLIESCVHCNVNSERCLIEGPLLKYHVLAGRTKQPARTTIELVDASNSL